ncbi:hypothetical protein RHMOL_Rhmol04G0227700 [Rhododendron molle]|uniref:Uncharacterized protein n=3 Tax=Rhododendron molle TaxID=49168 RepID=A0ACC0P5H7_RHOML|nr:hypothetical protein RHMOL_Rhmol04G0227700 [Rhododendron molle]KAI8560083.1 hypothetical protein RHMOL_Rhmol04G0227700 [Rhododendron molle]KAI8560084.1 hypothetical protein RHMOL_Rhmol04G0227700 [Rhododendron molle]
MSAPRDHSTTNASSSQQNIVSTVVSLIASTLPPKPPTGPTLGDNINEDVDGEEDGDGGKNGGGGDEGGGGEGGGGGGGGGGEGINQWKLLSKGSAPCWEHFDKGEINGKVKAKCHYCKKLLAANTKNGTKALNEHYKRCPRRKVADSSQKCAAHILNLIVKDGLETSQVSTKKSELDRYLEDDVIPRGNNSNEFASVLDDMDVDSSQSCVTMVED